MEDIKLNLAIFLALGSSMNDLKKTGQDRRFVDYYLKKYREYFKKIYVFSYEKEEYNLPPGITLITPPIGLNRFIYSLLMPCFHRKLIKECDVARVMQANGALPALITQKFYAKPALVTYGYDYAKFSKIEKHFFRARLFEIYEKVVLKQAAGFVAPSKESKKRLLELGVPENRVHEIPNGVDINLFSPAQKTFNPDHIDVLFVGRLEEQKNLKMLLEAVSYSRHKDKIYLTFVGRGSQREELARKAAEKQINLKIIESVSYSELPRYYQAADIFALVSRAEGHPKVLIEAASCGLPSLVSKELLNENFRDRENALGRDPEPRQLAAGLDELIGDENLRRILGQNARLTVQEKFNINYLLDKEIGILKSLAKSSKRRTA